MTDVEWPMGARKRRGWMPRNFTLQTYLCLVTCVLCATVLLSGLLIHFQQRMMRRHIIETGNTVASFLAGTLRIGLFAENADEIRTAIHPVLQDSQIVGVAVFDRGKRLLQSGTTAEKEARPGSEWVPVLSDELVADLEVRGGIYQEDEEQIVFWKPVRAAAGYAGREGLYFEGPLPARGRTEALGYVAVAVSKSQLRAGAQAIAARSMAVGLAFLLVGSLATYLVVRRASRPLRRLVDEVRKQGLSTSTGGDLGALSDTFSRLIESLDASFATINRLRLGLEQKVEERTAELSKINQELQAQIHERERIQEDLKRARDKLELRVSERTAELEVAYKKLLHSEKLSSLGTLTASIAHELNNPLCAIRGVLETLEAEASAGEEDSNLAAIGIQECDRISRLVSSLQSFYRPTSGAVAEIDLRETIESVLLICRKDFMRRGIRVETRYGEGVPQVAAVIDQIKQVILNLLNNARDAMADGGAIEIATEVRNGRAEIHVEDTGSGIEEGDMKYIFEPFFTTRSAAQGTGLGLSISHGIVKRHGGEIEVASRVGQGTRFTISLPAKKQPVKEETDVADSSETAASSDTADPTSEIGGLM
jgi:signal transduction histidine kinase